MKAFSLFGMTKRIVATSIMWWLAMSSQYQNHCRVGCFLVKAAWVVPSHGYYNIQRKANGLSRSLQTSFSSFSIANKKNSFMTLHSTATPSSSNSKNNKNSNGMINLHTIPKEELQVIIQSWGFPKYRANQVWEWVRQKGVLNINEMNNVPKKLRDQLKQFTISSSSSLVSTTTDTKDSSSASDIGCLSLEYEIQSKDGTIKRLYKLHDGQFIESVLMPYEDGRYTACISSQVGCAQGCVFCATGQMGFSRHLSQGEIVEQVSRFATELQRQETLEQQQNKNNENQQETNHQGIIKRKTKRLSNIVFMGMGEPLANYKNVVGAANQMIHELGIGARKITISTVGIAPNILKLTKDLPQVRLAVSLHCATDKERSELMPVNKRYGGLPGLMNTLKEYMAITNKRISFEWALIDGQNDTPETAHLLGRMLTRHYKLRRDMIHINVIPLNPTGGFTNGRPSARSRVNQFISILQDQYGIACTPRVRRGIDINAGCGQLKSEVERRKKEHNNDYNHRGGDNDGDSNNTDEELIAEIPSVTIPQPLSPVFGVYEDNDDYDDSADETGNDYKKYNNVDTSGRGRKKKRSETQRLIDLVKGTVINQNFKK